MTACVQQNVPIANTPPPPKTPRIEGHFKSVSATDIRDAIAVVRAHIRKDYGASLPIYQVYVIDHDDMSFQYWQHNTETYSYAKRAKGRWQMDEEHPDRVIVIGSNIPTG